MFDAPCTFLRDSTILRLLQVLNDATQFSQLEDSPGHFLMEERIDTGILILPAKLAWRLVLYQRL